MSVTFFPRNQSHVAGCEWDHDEADHEIYGPCTVAVLPEVNLSNSNAREILALLGLDSEDLCGSTDSYDFMGRVLLAFLSVNDEAREAYVSGGISHATMVECGRREGYQSDVLRRLVLVAQSTKDDICWS
jgi:hypothetical protein